MIGYGVAALSVATWIIALTVWHLGRIEQRWSVDVRPADVDR